MNNIPIKTTNDHLKRIASSTKPVNALAELIWNSLDAGANNISVTYETNSLGGLELIKIQDDGYGIDSSQIDNLFGNLGDSWKRTKDRLYGRPLHGQKGEGRFKAFSLGENVLWESVYEKEDKRFLLSIHGAITTGTTVFSYDDIQETANSRGTNVVISSVSTNSSKLFEEQTIISLTATFAGYLQMFPNIIININGTRIIPDAHCKIVCSKTLPSIKTEDGTEYSVNAEVIEWSIPIARKIQLCDDSGIELQEEDVKIQAKGECFSIRIRSDYFRVLDQQNLLDIESLKPDAQNIIEAARDMARWYFRRKKAEEAATIVQQWKDEEIYPFDDKAEKDLSAVELAERQVFDIIGVNVQDFLPDFEKADNASKKFTFRLLAQALKENPESLQKILTEVLDLDSEKQKEFAELLEKTDLQNIIKCAKTVSDRLNFILGLKNLLFDKETKPVFLERSQLHKILEKEAWIFDEDFTLSASEATLNEVLKSHLEELGKMSDDDTPVLQPDGREGRVDLYFGLAICPRQEERDHLVVELKRPNKKIDSEVITQIQKYAIAIANDDRFDKSKTHWKVIAVSNDMDSFGQTMTHQEGQPSGRIMQSGNIEVWAFTWSEILNKAEFRLKFLNDSLCYKADRESSKDYLLKKHKEYIPPIVYNPESASEDDAAGKEDDPEDMHD